MTPVQGGLVVLAAGVLMLAFGTLIRIGFSRQFKKDYSDEDLPAPLRNSGFTLLPNGVALSLLGLAILLAARDVSGWVIVILIPMILLAGGLGYAWRTQPPEWIKPDWLRELEAYRAKPPPGEAQGLPDRHPKESR